MPGRQQQFPLRVLKELRTWDAVGPELQARTPRRSRKTSSPNATARPDDGESHVILFDIVGGSCFSGVASLNGSIPQTYNGTWNQRGQSYCSTTYCARWTLAPYRRWLHSVVRWRNRHTVPNSQGRAACLGPSSRIAPRERHHRREDSELLSVDHAASAADSRADDRRQA
jgi:hypothetical protein